MKTLLKSIFFLLLFIISFSQSFAQNFDWGIHFNAGIGFIPFSGSDLDKFYSDYEIKPQFSYSYGGTVQYHFNHSLGIESGLSFLTINSFGYEDHDLYLPSGIYAGYYEFTDDIEASYFGMPFLFIYEHKKVQFKVGTQLNILLEDRLKTHSVISDSGIILEDITYENDLRSKSFDYGILFCIENNVFKNWSLNLRYYHGLQNIFKPDASFNYDIIRKNRQLSLGITYYL